MRGGGSWSANLPCRYLRAYSKVSFVVVASTWPACAVSLLALCGVSVYGSTDCTVKHVLVQNLLWQCLQVVFVQPVKHVGLDQCVHVDVGCVGHCHDALPADLF